MIRAIAVLAFSCLSVMSLAPALGAEPPADLSRDILLQADEVDYDTNAAIVTARGHIEIDDAGRILLADQVTYDEKKDTVVASGHVSVLDEKGNVAFADHVTLTDHLRNGALEGFAALIGKSGRLAAANAQRVGGQYTVAREIDYTPCKICKQPGKRTPVWQVHARRVVYDEVAHRFRFRNATLKFFGVPILYTPYLTEPDPSVKYASGILTPSVGNSTSIGYFIRVPVYIALSDSNDATIAPLLTTHGGEVLEGEYRQRWNDSGMWLQGSLANNPYGGIARNEDQTYAHAFGGGRFSIDDGWRTGYDLPYTSNDTYMQRYDISQLDRLVSDLFVEGEHRRSRLTIAGYYFEGLRASDNSNFIPFILPLFSYSLVPEDKIVGGQFRLNLTSADIQQIDGPKSQRVSGEVRLRFPGVIGFGQLLTVEAGARGDVYHVSNDGRDALDFPSLSTGSRFIERGQPYIMLDWRWPFVRDFERGSAIVVEPIAQFIAETSYGQPPSTIPNEDTAGFEFDENNVFSVNQLPGYDLLESGPRVNAGFRASAIFPLGSIETVWGQTYRFKSDPIFAADSGEGGTVSDIVGRVSVKFLPYIDLTDRIDLDRVDGNIRRHEVYLTATYGRSALEVSFTQLPPESVSLGLGARKEINTQADINFYGNWQVFAALRRDLIANQMLDDEVGLGYEDECLGVSLAYRKKFTTDRDLPPSTAVVLRFTLKTGEKPIEPFSLFPRDVFAHS